MRVKNALTGGALFPTLVKLAPRVGLEPTTLRLTAACSTIELPRNGIRPLAKRRRYGLSKTPRKHTCCPDCPIRTTFKLQANLFFIPVTKSYGLQNRVDKCSPPGRCIRREYPAARTRPASSIRSTAIRRRRILTTYDGSSISSPSVCLPHGPVLRHRHHRKTSFECAT